MHYWVKDVEFSALLTQMSTRGPAVFSAWSPASGVPSIRTPARGWSSRRAERWESLGPSCVLRRSVQQRRERRGWRGGAGLAKTPPYTKLYYRIHSQKWNALKSLSISPRFSNWKYNQCIVSPGPGFDVWLARSLARSADTTSVLSQSTQVCQRCALLTSSAAELHRLCVSDCSFISMYA